MFYRCERFSICLILLSYSSSSSSSVQLSSPSILLIKFFLKPKNWRMKARWERLNALLIDGYLRWVVCTGRDLQSWECGNSLNTRWTRQLGRSGSPRSPAWCTELATPLPLRPLHLILLQQPHRSQGWHYPQRQASTLGLSFCLAKLSFSLQTTACLFSVPLGLHQKQPGQALGRQDSIHQLVNFAPFLFEWNWKFTILKK